MIKIKESENCDIGLFSQRKITYIPERNRLFE